LQWFISFGAFALASCGGGEQFTVTLVYNSAMGAGTTTHTVATTGTSVNITALANVGNMFSHFEVLAGGITLVPPTGVTPNTADFIMGTANVVVQLHFLASGSQGEFYITVLDDGNGNGWSDPAQADAGDHIDIGANPNTGYKFSHWEVISPAITVADDTDRFTTFTMPAADVYLMAHFVPRQKFTVTVSSADNSQGVAFLGNGHTTYEFYEGLTVDIIAR